MQHYPSSVIKLIKDFSRLPGIGAKTAERLAMHILRVPRNEAERLSRSILEVKERVRLCSMCYALSDSKICNICNDTTRESGILCVVEELADMVSIEQSGSFSGLYHILQGVLSPLDGVGPDDIRIKELLSRISDGKVSEIILATSTSVEGEATASFIAGCLKDYAVKITRIASGVPMGGDLKYVDPLTMKRAMESRHAV